MNGRGDSTRSSYTLEVDREVVDEDEETGRVECDDDVAPQDTTVLHDARDDASTLAQPPFIEDEEGCEDTESHKGSDHRAVVPGLL